MFFKIKEGNILGKFFGVWFLKDPRWSQILSLVIKYTLIKADDESACLFLSHKNAELLKR